MVLLRYLSVLLITTCFVSGHTASLAGSHSPSVSVTKIPANTLRLVGGLSEKHLTLRGGGEVDTDTAREKGKSGSSEVPPNFGNADGLSWLKELDKKLAE